MTDQAETPQAKNSGDNRKMARATAGMSILTMAGFATGFIIKILLAHLFGTKSVANTYNYVYRLTQDIFRTWDKLFRPSFLPVLSKERERAGEDGAWRFVNTLISLQTLLLVAITVLLMVFSEGIVSALTSFVPSDAALAAHYLRLLAPSVLFLTLAVTGYMLLNSYKRFQLAAFGDHVFVKLVPCVTMVVVYAGLRIWAWLGGREFGDLARIALYALIAGIVLGAAFKLALYIWGLRKHLRHLRPQMHVKSAAMRSLGMLMLPLTVGVLVSFFRNRGEDVLLSAAVNGRAMTIIPYAKAPVDIPIQLFPVAMSIAIFPFLADYFAQKQHDALFGILGKALRIIFLVFVPLTVVLVILAHPLVSGVFGGGKFMPEDVALTASAMQWYALGYIAFGLEIVLLQFFYAAHQTFRPTYVGVIASLAQLHILFWVIIATQGFPVWHISAFTLAFSASKVIKVAVLFVMLATVYRSAALWVPMLKRTGASLLKIAAVSVIMGLALWFGRNVLITNATGRLMTLVMVAALSVAAGAIFIAGVHVLGVEEWRQALQWVKGKLNSR